MGRRSADAAGERSGDSGRPGDAADAARSLKVGSASWIAFGDRSAAEAGLEHLAAAAGQAGLETVTVTARPDEIPFGLARRIGAALIGDRAGDDPVFAGAGGFAWEQLAAGPVPAEETEVVVYGLSWLLLTLVEETGGMALLVGQADLCDPESQRVLEAMAGRTGEAGLALAACGITDADGRAEPWARFTLVPAVPLAPSAVAAEREESDPEAMVAAIRSLPAGSPEAVLLVVEAGHRLIEAGRPDDAAALAEDAIREASDQGLDPDPQLLVTAARASQLVIARRGRAVELTRIIAGSGPGAGSSASQFLGEIALERVNTVAAGRDAVIEAALAAVAPGRKDPGLLSGSLGWFFGCYALHLSERNRDALAVLDLAVAEAGRRHSLPDFVRAIGLRSGPLFHLGYLREAAVDCELALSAGIGDLEVWLPAVRSTLIQLRTFMLDLEGADRIAGRQKLAAGETATTMLFRFGRGTRHRLAGDSQPALDDFLDAGKLMADGLGNNPATMPWRSAAALTLAARNEPGDLDRATALAGEELELARQFGGAGPIGTALWARAMCEPDPERRIAGLQKAVDRHRQGERMVERIGAELALGQALVDAGRPDQARDQARETLHLSHVAGADLLAERARGILVTAGGKPRRPVTSGPESLTPAESRIVELAAAGFGNRELAGSLFLTVKTVEWHLTRAYTKLGVAGRDELAEALRPSPRGFRGPGGVDSLATP